MTKKNFLFGLIILIGFFAFNQSFSQTINFSGKNSQTSQPVNIDSIHIFDITLNRDTTIIGASSFDLNALQTGIVENSNLSKFYASLEQNIIDEIRTNAKFSVVLPIESNLNISVYNSLSQPIAGYRNFFASGRHSFEFSSNNLPGGVYFIAISNGIQTQYLKVLNLNSGSNGNCAITYTGSESLGNIKKLLKTGDKYNFTAYSTDYFSSSLYDRTPQGGENYEFSFIPKGSGELTKYSLLPIMYQHIKDSEGTTTRKNTEMVLLFEPNDTMHLFVGSDTDAVSFHGKYTIASGTVHIVITDPNFPVDVSFDVDTSADQITLPIQIFSNNSGTSSWKKTRPTTEAMMITIFNAIGLDESLPPDVIEDRIVDYTDAIKDSDPNSNIESVQIDGTDIKITPKEGMTIWVILYVYRFVATPVTLSTASLANDPRTHLNITSPNISTYDPPEKTALFIAPWDNASFPNWSTDASGNLFCDYTKMTSTFGADDNLDNTGTILTNYGYSVVSIKDTNAKVERIIEELLPGGGRTITPGFIYFSTHGLENGNLQTGTFFGTLTELGKWTTSIKAKYPDLWLYDCGPDSSTKVFSITAHGYGFRPGTNLRKVQITPVFWKWIVSKGTDFSKSFVHIGACLTDSTPDLRNNIKARAYLAYRIAVPSNFAGAVHQYSVNSLVRPTHSAEEVYYNIMRLAFNHQMIYAEDTTFRGKMPADNFADGPVRVWFRGYGFDATDVIPYQEAGWYKTTNIDQGAQWYLLWASRWGQDAQNGWQGIKNCWNDVWQYGDMGGLANPGCNAKTPGRVPTPEEVAYTGWLLKGEYCISPPGTIKKVPRFTLFDGK